MSEVRKIFNIVVQDRRDVRKRLFEANETVLDGLIADIILDDDIGAVMDVIRYLPPDAKRSFLEANITDEDDLSNRLGHYWSDTHQTYMN